MPKHAQYAIALKGIILEAIADPDKSDWSETLKGFDKDENFTDFCHALTNVMPKLIMEDFTGNKTDLLGHNHQCNRLIVQYIKVVESEDEKSEEE